MNMRLVQYERLHSMFTVTIVMLGCLLLPFWVARLFVTSDIGFLIVLTGTILAPIIAGMTARARWTRMGLSRVQRIGHACLSIACVVLVIALIFQDWALVILLFSPLMCALVLSGAAIGNPFSEIGTSQSHALKRLLLVLLIVGAAIAIVAMVIFWVVGDQATKGSPRQTTPDYRIGNPNSRKAVAALEVID